MTLAFGRVRRMSWRAGGLQPCTYMFDRADFHILFTCWPVAVRRGMERMWGSRTSQVLFRGGAAPLHEVVLRFCRPIWDAVRSLTIGASGAVYGVARVCMYFPNRRGTCLLLPIPAK